MEINGRGDQRVFSLFIFIFLFLPKLVVHTHYGPVTPELSSDPFAGARFLEEDLPES